MGWPSRQAYSPQNRGQPFLLGPAPEGNPPPGEFRRGVQGEATASLPTNRWAATNVVSLATVIAVLLGPVRSRGARTSRRVGHGALDRPL